MPVLHVPIRSDKFSLNVLAHEELVDVQTKFQRIQVYETPAFGRVLLLDGHIQLTELDEHAYHESLVHLPAIGLATLRTALVIGGGDGGVIRELVRHPSLVRVDMVEIDAGVVEACREHMPSLSAGAFDDPRVQLHIADAFPFVRQAPTTYDLIIVDSTDTYEDETGALSEMLFTPAFYADLRTCLNPGGVVATQADNPVFCPYSTDHIEDLFRSVFTRTGRYRAVVPSFGCMSGFVWGSQDHSVPSDPSRVDWSLGGFRYLSPATYAFAFAETGF